MTNVDTLDLNRIVEHQWDVIVLGGGPAGSVAARQLALSGAKVLLVEKKAFPRPKVCGACLSGQAIDILLSIGLDRGLVESGTPFDSFRLGMSRRAASFSMPQGIAVSRSRLDDALLCSARDAGVVVLEDTQGSLGELSGDQRSVRLTRHPLDASVVARVVVVAGGLNGIRLGEERPFTTEVAAWARVGASCTVSEFPEFYRAGTIQMAVGRGGYVGLTRIEDGFLNVAAAFDADFLRGQGAPARAAASVLVEAGFPEIVSLENAAWIGTVPLTRSTRPVASERVFLIGDATGYVEPFTGEGMTWAIAAARAVAPLVLKSIDGWSRDLESAWCREFEQLIGRRQRFCRAMAYLLRHPFLCRLAFESSRCLPAVAGLFVDSVCQPDQPIPKPMRRQAQS